jgi:uncharacterized protein
VKIDLTHVESEPVSFCEELEIPAEDLDPSHVASSARVVVEGSVRRYGDGFRAVGTTRSSVNLLCVRCLEPVAWNEDEEFTIELRPRLGPPSEEEIELGDEDLEVMFMEEEVLDLAALAAEQVLLALPMRALCSEQCAGLCPSCGANRNRGEECGCEPEIDPRWNALKELNDRKETG